MATETLYFGSNGRYYTAAGLGDYLAYGSPAANFTSTPREATVLSYTVSVIDQTWLKLRYGSSAYYTRTENGTSVKHYNNATDSITVKIYKYNNSYINVFGAHPGVPGYSSAYSSQLIAIYAIEQNSAKASYAASYIFEEGVYGSLAANRQSGSAYDAAKITYDSSNKCVYFGADVAAGKSFVLCATFPWFLCLNGTISDGVTVSPTANATTRTVAVGKSRALISDVEDYNSGSNASLSTKKSTSGSQTSFVYWNVRRRHLGQYYPGQRILPAYSGTDPSTGGAVVLRGVNTKSTLDGAFYPVGSDVADILTRNPSYDSYDTRVTLYGVWTHRYAITVAANGGTGGTAAFYFSTLEAYFYSDEALESRMSAVTPPAKSSSRFLGLYTEDNTASTMAVAANGEISGGWTPEADATLYAQWHVVVDVTFDKAGGSGGADMIWYDSAVPGFVLPDTTTAIAQVETPTLECFAFLGYFTAATGGDKKIDADGTLLAALTDSPPAAPLALYAQWQRVSWRMALDSGGGDGGEVAIYCNGEDAVFYKDDQLQNDLGSVVVPEKPGYSFGGYFAEAEFVTKAIDETGDFLLSAFSENGTLYAKWDAETFVLEFNANGGSVSADSMSVTFGEAVGTLPTPTPPPARPDSTFMGWELGGATITAATVWNLPHDAVAVARWLTAFGAVEDFFGLASYALVPVASTTGDTRHRVTAAHGGKYESGVNQVGGIWRNPSVTYVVKANTTVSVKLGQAFAAVKSGNTMTRSGYMITSVEIVTEVGKFPTVTVSAVANEGENAVNNFKENKDKFNVSVPVVARSKAQNLLGAISGGGHLQRCALVATCDPVVCEENLMPCASDIVNGRYELAAETLAANLEAAPTSDGGFAIVGVPQSFQENDYIRYAVEARREMI